MRVYCVLRVYLTLLQVMLEEYLVWRILLVGSDEFLATLSLDVFFLKFRCLSFRTLVFGIVIMYFLRNSNV